MQTGKNDTENAFMDRLYIEKLTDLPEKVFEELISKFIAALALAIKGRMRFLPAKVEIIYKIIALRNWGIIINVQI